MSWRGCSDDYAGDCRGNPPDQATWRSGNISRSHRRPIKQSERTEGLFPYYGANGLQGTIDSFIFDEPLILLAEDGGHFDDPDRGIAYEISGKTWVNNHAHVLKPKNGSLDLTYLRRVLENYDVRPFINGSTRSKLTKAQAERIPIPLPPLDEQRRIAAILDKADALRRMRKGALELLDSLSQSIFREMFLGARTTNKWEEVAFRDLIEEFRYGTSNKSAQAGYPVLRIPNIIHGQVNLFDLKTVPLNKREFQRLRMRDGDLLLVRTNGNPEYVGRCAVADRQAEKNSSVPIEDFVYASYLIRARLTTNRINPYFIQAFLSSREGRKAMLERSKTSAGQFNINTEGLSSILIPVPPMELQETFARNVWLIRHRTASAVTALRKTETLFTSLQSRAFSGQF